MSYTVIFTPEAQEQLVNIYRYIAKNASPATAERYTGAILDYCEGLAMFPERSVLRDDIRPGLRITNYRGRTVIAYAVNGELVEIIGVFYGGQDFETALS